MHDQDACWVTVVSIGKAGRTNATEDKCFWHVRPSHFGNPAKSQLLSDYDSRRLCDLRSREVCLYRLSFKEGDPNALNCARPRHIIQGFNPWDGSLLATVKVRVQYNQNNVNRIFSLFNQ